MSTSLKFEPQIIQKKTASPEDFEFNLRDSTVQFDTPRGFGQESLLKNLFGG